MEIPIVYCLRLISGTFNCRRKVRIIVADQYRHLRLNNGKVGDASGVSDGVILIMLARGIGADTADGARFLCTSNKIRAWCDACIARLDEIKSQKKPAFVDVV